MMRPVLLVARREYAENAKTKGFWLGLLFFPIMVLVGMKIPQFLERVKSTRYITVIDPRGELTEPVDATLKKLYARALLKEWQAYSRDWIEAPEKLDLESRAPIDGRIEAFLEKVADDNAASIASLVDGSAIGGMVDQVRDKLKPGAPDFEPPDPGFVLVPPPADIDLSRPAAEIAEDLKPYLRGDQSVEYEGQPVELFAAVVMTEPLESLILRPSTLSDAAELAVADKTTKGIQYWASNLADNDFKNAFERSLNDRIREQEYERLSVDSQIVERVEGTRARIVALNPKKAEGEEGVSLGDQIRQWAPVAFVYLLWIGIFSISQMLLNNTIEEKSNRIIEVLLSSVTANELMFGKLVGIAGIGLTMIGTWIGSLLVIVTFYSSPESKLANEILEILTTSGLLPAFATYFLLGYLIYAGLFLAIGSICNTLKDAQNLVGPVMLVMFVPLVTMFFIPQDPNGPLATALSWIPIYTPFIMLNRSAADPPTFDVVGTIVLLIVTAGVVLWGSGRVFRVGILRTGQPPRLIELLRWVRGGRP